MGPDGLSPIINIRAAFLALSLTFTFTCLLAGANSAEDSESSFGLNLTRGIDINKVLIQGFDLDRCGRAALEEWQMKENAFGCTDLPRKSSVFGPRKDQSLWSRIFNPFGNEDEDEFARSGGTDVGDREFPFFVQIKRWSRKKGQRGKTLQICGGALIDRGLVITTAECVADVSIIRVFVKSNLNLNAEPFAGIPRRADKWCHKRGSSGFGWGVGIIKLHDLAPEIAGRVYPACLFSPYRHLDSATCALVGLGSTTTNPKPNRRVQTGKVQRVQCEEELEEERDAKVTSCYKGAATENACSGENGAPIFCYDKCNGRPSRAFVVGAVNSGPEASCDKSKGDISRVTDFNLAHETILELLYALKYNKLPPDVVCETEGIDHDS